jgi:hypothetical protein
MLKIIFFIIICLIFILIKNQLMLFKKEKKKRNKHTNQSFGWNQVVQNHSKLKSQTFNFGSPNIKQANCNGGVGGDIIILYLNYIYIIKNSWGLWRLLYTSASHFVAKSIWVLYLENSYRKRFHGN